jgi:uncharacterized protein DUF481
VDIRVRARGPLALAGRTAADEILFLNGDRITGKIVSADGGKLTIKSDTAGDVTVDLSKVKTFSTDEPIVIKAGDTTLKSKVTGGANGTVQVVPVAGRSPQVIALKDVAKTNPPPVKWTGSFVANGLITTGNSETENFGVSLDAVRRTEMDRITLGGAYYYGRQLNKATDEKETTINNWFILGKYDYFLTKQLYLYGAARVEQDEIANLDLRLTIGGGVGYQWFETPTFNLSTEAGLAWVYERPHGRAACLPRGLDALQDDQALPQPRVAAEPDRPDRRLQPEYGRRPAGDGLRGFLRRGQDRAPLRLGPGARSEEGRRTLSPRRRVVVLNHRAPNCVDPGGAR